MAENDGQEPKTLEELSAKVSDLTQGIASYRDKAQQSEKIANDAKAEAAAAKAEAEAAKKEAEEAKKGNSNDDDKAIKLSESDQKKLDAWAKENGYVTKAEMEAQRVSLFQESVKGAETQAVEEFISRHPEYSDKEKWDKVKEEFDQYKPPTSLTGYRNLLSKIHKQLSESDEKEAEIRAKEEQKKRLGLGGSNNRSDDSEGEMTMEKLREKYPRLSEEQITSRLAEISDLAAAREKRNSAKKK